MKKSLPVIIIAIVVILGGWYLYTKNKDSANTSPSSISSGNKEDTQSGDTFVGSLKKAIERNIPMECSFEVNGNEYKNYIKGKQLYGEVKTDNGNAYMLIHDECMWTWNKKTKQGIKTCFTNKDDGQGSVWDNYEKQAHNDQYNCHPTTVNENLFKVPNDVKFMDIDSMGK